MTSSDLGKDLVAASARPLLLSILAAGEEYGYAILQRVQTLSGGRIGWSEGMLYPVLHRLEAEGLVLSRWRVAENGRRRKYYRLSSKGKPALQRERERWMAVHDTLARSWEAVPCTN